MIRPQRLSPDRERLAVERLRRAVVASLLQTHGEVIQGSRIARPPLRRLAIAGHGLAVPSLGIETLSQKKGRVGRRLSGPRRLGLGPRLLLLAHLERIAELLG